MRAYPYLYLLTALCLTVACANDDTPLGSGSYSSSDNEDTGTAGSETSGSASTTSTVPGDGDGDGDGDGGDGDGGPGDGDGDGGPGDGDGDSGPGDGDGDGDDSGPGDGDGGPGDGDGDGSGDGDGDGAEEGYVGFGNYQIGATEVSVGEYAQFLAANYNLNQLPPQCSWKPDFIPQSWNVQANTPQRPVVRVDWCDAWAYCDWEGGHLCGHVNGGPADLSEHDDPLINEWYRACSNGGTTLFPYGNLYNGNNCNTADYGLGALAPVGSIGTCEGGIAGLFDMSGNVWEWTNACENDPNTPDDGENCRRRGGSYFSSGDTTRCAIDSVRPRADRNSNTGFRCCITN